MQKLAEQERRVESEFERQVLNRLLAAGYRVIPQWPVGAYRIDLVVEGNNWNRLAVECDGDRWHPIEKLEADMARQAILERLGWRFVRIRESLFFRDPGDYEASFCSPTGIRNLTEEQRETGKASEQSGQELKQRVIRRAAELYQQWSRETGSRNIVVPSSKARSRII